MDFFTMNRNYARQIPIDFFNSAIWTERVRGNGDFQLSVPATKKNIKDLSIDTFVGITDSKVVMMIDSQTIKDNVLKVVGTSLEQNLNSRFVRLTSNQKQKSKNVIGSPGYVIQYLVQSMAIDSAFLDGTIWIGIQNPQRLKIPYFSIGSYDELQPVQSIAVTYGQLYDAIKAIADSYELAMRIERLGEQNIVFRNWVPIDHTSEGPNTLVRFSPQLDNLSNTTEVLDASKAKTHAWVYASGLPSGGVSFDAGEATIEGSYFEHSGWDLKAVQVFADDITVVLTQMNTLLAERAYEALVAAPTVIGVDGEIMPTCEYKYGIHYDLGDIVEAQGTTGIIQKSRVTEFIRSQDATGEKAYPTLVAYTPPPVPFIPGVSGGPDGQGGGSTPVQPF